jgi:hypothetical protein
MNLRIREHRLGSSGSGYELATGSSESTTVVTGSTKGAKHGAGCASISFPMSNLHGHKGSETWRWLRQYQLSNE